MNRAASGSCRIRRCSSREAAGDERRRVGATASSESSKGDPEPISGQSMPCRELIEVKSSHSGGIDRFREEIDRFGEAIYLFGEEIDLSGEQIYLFGEEIDLSR
jgi:hypothetical protein